MYVVIYHSKNVGSYFVGVADSYEIAEKIIQQDMSNNGTSCDQYHIEKVWLNAVYTLDIERVVAQDPYKV